MESIENPIEIYRKGFHDGYNHVVEVIDLVIQKESHANPHVRRSLNQAFTIMSQVLTEALPTILETFNDRLRPPPSSNPR